MPGPFLSFFYVTFEAIPSISMKHALPVFGLVFLLQFPVRTARTQPLRRMNSSAYNINDGLLQSTIEDLNFDALGFMWISFETGLQRFDGNAFQNIPVQSGLPDNHYIKLFRAANGRLWFCHSKGISIYDEATDRFRQVFSYPAKVSRPAIWPVNEENGVVYFYESDGYIDGFDERRLQLVQRSRFPFASDRTELPEEFFTTGAPVCDAVTICFRGSTLLRWNLPRGAVTTAYHIPGGIQINGQEFHMLDTTRMLSIIDGRLQVLDLQRGAFRAISERVFNRPGFDGVAFGADDGQRFLMSISNEVFQVDARTLRPVAQLVNFQNQPFAHFSIRYIRTDPFGNIYLVTRNEGFVKLLANTFPISYYGSNERSRNFITSLCVDKNSNRVLAGTLNGGLLVFDTLQRLQQRVEQLGRWQPPGPLTIVGIVPAGHDRYLLFPRFSLNSVLWNAVTGQVSRVPMASELRDSLHGAGDIGTVIQYYCSALRLGPGRELLAIDQNLYEIDRHDPFPLVRAIYFRYRTKGLCLYHHLVVNGTAEQLLFREPVHYAVIRTVPLPGCGEIRCIDTFHDLLYVGTSRGLYLVNGDGKVLSHYSRISGLPDDYIYSLAIDAGGNVWCSTNRGIVRINPTGSLLQLGKQDGLQENEFNTNVLDQEPGGELFFGGVNGISSFYPNQINDRVDTPRVYFTTIKVNDGMPPSDSATWFRKSLSLPYNANNLYFEFTALGKRMPEQYVYQYRLLPVNRGWLSNPGNRGIRYLLPPGHYVLQVYAGVTYQEHPRPMRSISIVIAPPFWNTWWFSLAIAVLVTGTVALVVRQLLYRQYQKQLHELELKNELQHERERISRDLHDNLGAQISFISSNIDWIIDHQDEMDKPGEIRQMMALNSTAKNVMINLRETIWALHKESITVQEFSDKLKSYIQHMLQLQPGLAFRADEQIVNNRVLTPTGMLHLFRICQEAVNNVMKHAHASLLTLIVTSGDEFLYLCIRDNGVGFPLPPGRGDHFGLQNMRHRAGEAEVKLTITSGKDTGTSIEMYKYYK